MPWYENTKSGIVWNQPCCTWELNSRSNKGKGSIVTNAIGFRLKRLAGEYLLKELATQGFLPGYGFPTHLASFDNLTIAEYKRTKKKKDDWRANKDRDDNLFRRRELATRGLDIALREYAPGSEVILNGLVYTSAGLTLNWQRPAAESNANEIQNFRYAWRCDTCGSSGSEPSRERAKTCRNCKKEIKNVNVSEFIEPAGFAVDFFETPTNDVTTQIFVPVEEPWVNAEGLGTL